ncbi:MAG TPA: transposase [Thermoanaerobaculaceae bacterium]|nr:transposase [Thermoanaerobaculaceae bacterium]
MPRKPRIFVPGAAYHVYCRFARGERFLAEDDSAGAFVECLRKVKDEHRLVILAWCLMPNHYHLVVRSGELPLWRSMRLVQGRFAKATNRKRRSFGPVWQGRYKARVIEDSSYLLQAIAYVHLNPVASGMVDDPARHRWNGHRELLGRGRVTLVDVDEALLVFGSTRTAARRSYRGVLGRGREEAWLQEGPGRLPWWRRQDPDDETPRPERRGPRLDWLGLAPPPEPLTIEPAMVVAMVARACGVVGEVLTGRGQRRGLTRARELVMLLGVETCGLRVKDLAAQLGRDPGTASRLYTQAVKARAEDPTLAVAAEAVAKDLRGAGKGS